MEIFWKSVNSEQVRVVYVELHINLLMPSELLCRAANRKSYVSHDFMLIISA